jgi:putative CocE/NonD family hydrolase
VHDDPHWLPPEELPAPARRVRAAFSSHYLVLRDGERMAIDLWLPKAASATSPVPAIVRQTRYLRSLMPRSRVFGPVAEQFDLYARMRRVFLGAGYAWIDADVRGTGASSGSWPCPWSPDEVRDGGELADWIIKQDWSNGRVGSLGISYDGTCADMLITNRHPAVKAVAPLFSLYDVWTDAAFPGGIHLRWFMDAWGEYNAALDRDAFPEAVEHTLWLIGRSGAVSPSPRPLERTFAILGRRGRDAFRRTVVRGLGAAIRGVRPVDGDDATLAAALASRHANVDVGATTRTIGYRDQTGLSPVFPDGTLDWVSPHARRADAMKSGAAVYSISGWRDGAYPHSAIKRHLSLRTPGSQLLLGPWNHAGLLCIRPFEVAAPTRFDHALELLRFFDRHLKEDGRANGDAPVRYYTMVEGAWKTARSWPPPGTTTRTLYLGEGRALVGEAPVEHGHDAWRDEGKTGTGERSRWRSLLSLVPGDYLDRRERDAELLFWESPPLESDLEMTGHPIVALYVSWDDTDDGRVFAYLEDVAPDGRVAYVSEGQLRAMHRRVADEGPYETPAPWHSYCRADATPVRAGQTAEMRFDLLPISWLFRRGHRLRLVVTANDADHFEVHAPTTLRIHRGFGRASRIELPVMG